MLVTLVDLGLGNINSLYNSFKKIGVELNVSNNIKEIDKSDKLILPGVGAFNYAIKRINNLEIYDSILEFNHKKKYILGLCLGMQLFFLDSEENTTTKGLGILEGNIKSIKNDLKIKVPNIGWRKLNINNSEKKIKILKNISSKDYFYFIHSYYAKNINKVNSVVMSQYFDNLIPSVVVKENIIGTQFHPEKSGEKGLIILKNFIEL